MNQKQKLAHFKSLAEQYQNKFNLQKIEIEKLKTTLKDISVGLAPVSYSKDWDHQTKLRFSAAEAICNYKHIEAPKGSFYP